MNLFDYAAEGLKEKEAPLAARMRPKTLEEVVGQEDIIGKNKLLYRAIKADRISSVIFMDRRAWGKRLWLVSSLVLHPLISIR